jgi:serine/threonine protein kinase
VVPIHAAGEEDGRLYLVMRFVDGTDLFNEVASHGPLVPQRVARLAGQLAGALDAAHARGLVHRDVKPANTLLSGSGENEHALLTDFGLTKEAAGQSGLTATGQLLGTLDYVAPEQLDGRELDARTDIYALGCLLFECLTGHPPFAGTPAAKMYAHLHTPPPAVEGLAPALGVRVDEALGRAMAKELAQRFPSAGDLGRAFAAAVQDRPNATPERSVAVGPAATQVGVLGATVIDAPPPPARRREPRLPPAPVVATPSEAPPAPRRRTGLLAGAAAALLLVGGGAGAAFALLGGDDGAEPAPTTGGARGATAGPAAPRRQSTPAWTA